jgi:hypothetical protein
MEGKNDSPLSKGKRYEELTSELKKVRRDALLIRPFSFLVDKANEIAAK